MVAREIEQICNEDSCSEPSLVSHNSSCTLPHNKKLSCPKQSLLKREGYCQTKGDFKVAYNNFVEVSGKRSRIINTEAFNSEKHDERKQERRQTVNAVTS